MNWVRDLWDAMEPYSSGGVYVNYHRALSFLTTYRKQAGVTADGGGVDRHGAFGCEAL